jgi:hypothetical protein
MELTIKTLEAKRDEYAAAAEQHKTLMNANVGALQAIEELLAVARAPEPANTAKEKK